MSLRQSPALAPVLRQQAEIIIHGEREVAARSGEIPAQTKEAEKRGTNLRQTKLESH